MSKNIFGDFYDRAFSFKQSPREKQASESELWSAAIMSGSGEQATLESGIKFSFLRLFLLASFVVVTILCAQMFNLQIINGARNQLLADSNRVRQTVLRAPRGTIYDTNKEILARNIASFDLVVTPARLPKKAEQRDKLYAQVANLTGINAAEIKTKSEQKTLLYGQHVLVAGRIEREKALAIEEKAKDLTAYELDTNPVREYLDNGTFPHFLGYTGRVSAEDLVEHPNYQQTDFIGKNGLEQAYEDDLKGINGREQTEVDSTGKSIKVLASKEATPGNNLQLALDKKLQQKMYDSVTAAAAKAGSGKAMAIAMNPANGQILGAVNAPSYDNNLFAKGISDVDYAKLLNDKNNPLFNKATDGGYPLGSTVKPLLSAAALEEKIVTASTTVNDTGKIDVPNIYNPSIVYTFKGWKAGGLGVVNVVRAISQSSDIFFYYVGGGFQGFRGLGITRLVDWYQKFGIGHKTGIELESETGGNLPTPESKKARTGESWFVGDTYNLSIGQGNMMASPLQLVTAISAVANGGTLYKPRLAKAILDEKGNVVREIKPSVTRAGFVSPQNIALVKTGMRQTIESGTARQLNSIVPVPVAGKTGTAETSSDGFDGKNPQTKPHAWFVSYAPADNPTIALVVMVEYAGEGTEFAAPAAGEILKWYFEQKR